MAAKQFFIPHLTATVAGIAQPGARFYFYTTGTLTPESTYSDSGLSVERTNPVVCDASGALPVTYLDNTKTYRVRICDKNDVLLSGGDIDPFIPGVFPDAAVLQPYQDAAEDAATAAAASASAAATSATNASDSEDNAASSASAASSSATAASASASAASSSASAAADSATAASASASAAATSATAADASADDAAASAAAAAAAVVPVPTGGAEGQVLAKASASDFDTEWADPGGTSEELSTRDYGAALDGVTNDYSAFTSIQTDRLANTNPLYGYGYGTQKTRVSFGVSLIGANTIDIYGTTRMEGDGTGVAGGGVSVLKFTGETTAGIRVQSGNTSGASSSGGSFVTGAGSIIDGLHLQGGYVSTPGEYHGIHVRATCVIRDTNIFNFAGSGVFADTTLGSGGATEGQFNLSRIDTVAVEGCKNGFYVHGGDANAGTFLNCSAIGNREYGFYDDSFLGNTWIACHAAGNTLGGYRTDPTNANQAPLFIGCYEEAGQPASVFGPRTLRVGGFWSNSDENSGGGIIAAVDDKVVTNDLSVLGGVEATGEAIVHGNITGRGNSFMLGPTTGTADNELRLIARNAFNQLSFYNNDAPQGSITARDNGTDYYFTEHRFHSANGGTDYSKIDSTGMLFYGAGTSQYWKDATPTKASSVGPKVPGGSASDDLIFARYDGSLWAEAGRISNANKTLDMLGGYLVNGTTVFNSSGALQAAAFPALTGDVTTSAGAIATTIANNAVSFAKFVAAGSAGFVGATGAGNYSHRTPTQVTAALDAMVGDSGSGGTKGLVPAPASGDSSKYLKGDGTWASVGADPWTYAFVASDVTNSTTTPSNVTGLAFTPAASKKYEFEAFLSLTSAATTTGAQVGLTWPTGSTFSMASIQIQSGAITVNETGGDASAELVCSVTAAPSATASFPGKIKGTITMGGSPSGSVQVRIRSEVGASQVAVKAGSWIKWREIA